MVIKDLPKEIRDKVWEHILTQKFDNKVMGDLSPLQIDEYDNHSVNYSLCWDDTPEGFYFWSNIDNEEFNEFYERYPKGLTPELEAESEALFAFFKS